MSSEKQTPSQGTADGSSSHFKPLKGTDEKVIGEHKSIQLQDTLQNAARELEAPAHTLHRLLGYYTETASIKTAIDLGIFKLLAENPNPYSVDELASTTKTDPQLLARVLRYLAAKLIITETSQDHYTSNGTTLGFTDSRIENGFKFLFAVHGPAVLTLPEYLKETNYRNNPDGPLAFNKALNTDLTFYSWIQQRPEELSWFSDLMSLPHRGSWLDVVPFAGMDSEDTVFVDVGGNIGHNCAAVLEKHPELRGKVVLQDQPEMIAIAKPIEGVKAMEYDFFTPQVVKGAKYYYFRSIFHNWSDEKVVEILQNLVPAMGPNSRLLIDEAVIVKTGAHWWPAWIDLQMYILLGTKERTVDQWTEILDKAGLKLVETRMYNPEVQIGVTVAALK